MKTTINFIDSNPYSFLGRKAIERNTASPTAVAHIFEDGIQQLPVTFAVAYPDIELCRDLRALARGNPSNQNYINLKNRSKSFHHISLSLEDVPYGVGKKDLNECMKQIEEQSMQQNRPGLSIKDYDDIAVAISEKNTEKLKELYENIEKKCINTDDIYLALEAKKAEILIALGKHEQVIENLSTILIQFPHDEFCSYLYAEALIDNTKGLGFFDCGKKDCELSLALQIVTDLNQNKDINQLSDIRTYSSKHFLIMAKYYIKCAKQYELDSHELVRQSIAMANNISHTSIYYKEGLAIAKQGQDLLQDSQCKTEAGCSIS